MIMIIVKLQGGLGNQMFQYAVGKKISLLHNLPLKLDLNFLLDRSPRKHFTYRNYNLNIFQFTVEVAKKNDIEPFLKLKNMKLRHKLLSNIWGKDEEYKYIKEKSFLFDQTIFQYYPNIYLDGYWQSENYFSDIKATIQEDFQLKTEFLSNQEQKWLKQIQESTSICLHIRRGDLISNPAANQFHGIVSLAYINQAIQIITSKISLPTFFIFSDDIIWCKQNIKLNYPAYFIEHQNSSEKFSIDFQLMQNCKHFIISNSTFSWWTAWLSQNPEKIVIAPKHWFRSNDINTKDIIPQNWIKI